MRNRCAEILLGRLAMLGAAVLVALSLGALPLCAQNQQKKLDAQAHQAEFQADLAKLQEKADRLAGKKGEDGAASQERLAQLRQEAKRAHEEKFSANADGKKRVLDYLKEKGQTGQEQYLRFKSTLKVRLFQPVLHEYLEDPRYQDLMTSLVVAEQSPVRRELLGLLLEEGAGAKKEPEVASELRREIGYSGSGPVSDENLVKAFRLRQKRKGGELEKQIQEIGSAAQLPEWIVKQTREEVESEVLLELLTDGQAAVMPASHQELKRQTRLALIGLMNKWENLSEEDLQGIRKVEKVIFAR